MRLFALALALLAASVRAEPLPLWELGVGAAALSLPDYRGSDEGRSYLFPLPYFVLRDRRLRLDREGARAVLFESTRLELNISANAAPPVNSDENQARQGMPHLDPTFEAGPQAQLTLLGSQASDTRLDLRLPARAVVASDLSYADAVGFVFYPHLNLRLRPAIGGGQWNLGLQAGPLFATRKFHQYFYGVDARFATSQRPAYSAPGGYSGAMALASLSRRFQKVWVGGFVRYDALSGAAFEDSPLVRRKSSVMAGVAFAYVFAESAEKVEARD
jgi:outer membrane scaffolding protein for murein synthesis (MipA/OmpV family)